MEGYAQPHGAEAAEMHSDLCISVSLPGMAGHIFVYNIWHSNK